jgi:hypothetical protein
MYFPGEVTMDLGAQRTCNTAVVPKCGSNAQIKRVPLVSMRAVRACPRIEKVSQKGFNLQAACMVKKFA